MVINQLNFFKFAAQLSTVGNLAPSSSQAATFGPTVPSSSDLFSPSLPEEETKRSCGNSQFVSFC